MIDLDDFSDILILAGTAYGENRGGGTIGMQSVLNVIMNRARKPSWWGDTPRNICLKPKQFDCWMPNDPNYRIVLDACNDCSYDKSFTDATNMSIKALDETLSDITSGATYYFSSSMSSYPYWAKGHIPCAEIAGQLFFNDIN